MQRSKSLIPLSHDHHHGLVVSRHILEGLKRNVELSRIADYICAFWTHDLARHFAEEEQLIFPLLPEDDKGRRRAESEHAQLRMAAEKFGGPDTQLHTDELAGFAELLQAHIRFEERELFPHIEATADQSRLKGAGVALQLGIDKEPFDYPDAFWK